MNILATLARREWLQHRLGWSLMALLPTALIAPLLAVADVDLQGSPALEGPKSAVLGLASLGVPTALHLAMFWIASLIIVAGLARRDHGDRSVEFWLSMPVGHASALAAPLIVHLLLVPIAALGIGLLSGMLVSLLVVTRVAGLDAWLALPWVSLIGGSVALAGRLALGVLLATLWLSPVILGVVLLTAWFRRWGLVIGAVGVGMGSGLMDRLLGYPLPWTLLSGLAERASRSLLNAGQARLDGEPEHSAADVLHLLPGWLAGDAANALALLLSPWFVGAMAASAVLFAGLVQWRRRGAAAGS